MATFKMTGKNGSMKYKANDRADAIAICNRDLKKFAPFRIEEIVYDDEGVILCCDIIAGK